MNMLPRVIPVLLLKDDGLYKTKQFKNPVYIGDPINAVKIFNEKEVDELVILDFNSTINNREIDYELLTEIASEAFMPLSFGGGVKNLEQINNLINCGYERVIINTAAIENPDVIKKAVTKFGSSTIIVSVDVKKDLFGRYHVYSNSGTMKSNLKLNEWIECLNSFSVGEILLSSIDRDGMMSGYDVDLIKHVSNIANMPVITCCGASNLSDFNNAVKAGASAVAAGSMFVFHGKHKAVLISYPSKSEINSLWS